MNFFFIHHLKYFLNCSLISLLPFLFIKNYLLIFKIANIQSSKITTMEYNMSDDEDEKLTYEERREKRIKENMALFDLFGVNEAAKAFSDSLKKVSQEDSHAKKTLNKESSKTLKEPTRRSLRLANLPAPEILFEKSIIEDKSNQKRNSCTKKSISVPKEDITFFKKLKEDLIITEAVNDFQLCDFEKFTNVLKSLEMNEQPIKVMNNRIYSIAIHPSETSLLIVSGDMNGNIAIHNKNNADTSEFNIHNGPVNCISFCTWDPYKLFSTSHDGSVRCGDIINQTFDIIYTTDLCADQTTQYTHSTWHTEYEKSILIGNGSGHVDLIDTRNPNKISNTAWCHKRSVRTVQCHPMEKHYFLTSSGIGEVSLWDIRNMTNDKINPVLQFEHFKSLTSAFFSPSGMNMLSTSNDNYIRIFNTSELTTKATKPIKKIYHDNHTGRYLSVFKAKWNPGRDDAFFIGSLSNPKNIQIYCSDGNLLHNLISQNMTTYCPVIEVHPTQAIYVGGNSSGKLHIFSTKQQL